MTETEGWIENADPFGPPLSGMTGRRLPSVFGTKTSEPSGVAHGPCGWSPTGMVVMTLIVDRSMTETVSSAEFVTYAFAPASADAPSGVATPKANTATSGTDTNAARRMEFLRMGGR